MCLRLHRLWAAAAVLAAGLAIMAVRAGVVSARPPEPASIWGVVRVDGADAPNGTRVEFWSGGKRVADTIARVVADVVTDTLYIYDLPGDDPETAAVEGLTAGALVQFRVFAPGMLVTCNATTTWQPGANVQVDLNCERVAPAAVLRLPVLLRQKR